MPRRATCRRGFAAAAAAALTVAMSVATAGATPTAAPSAPATRQPQPIYFDTRYPFEVRAADLVSRMTLAEKVQQLHTGAPAVFGPRTVAPAIPRLGVHEYVYANEAQHGIASLGSNTNPGTGGTIPQATSFPTNFAATMSWDKNLMYQETSAISDEARGLVDKSLWGTGQNNLGTSASDYGGLTYWAPTVNMDRDPRWGRADEAFGEDPYLVGQMAGAFVDGFQGETMSGQPLTPYLKAAATAKHYAMNNTENDRLSGTSNTDDANIRDYYTAQFRSLAENAHVSGVMTSYNAINGTPAAADTYTANELLQRTYGFNGYTTSDCGGVGTTYLNPPNGHDWAPPGWTTDSQGQNATWTNTATGTRVAGAAGGQAYSLRAGTQLNCDGTAEATLPNIQQAIDAGVLSEGVIDNALVHIFTVRMETGEFDPPAQVPYTKITKDVIESPAHQALAEKVAANSLVLLKNNNVTGTSTPLLPASAATLNKVVILGDLANTVTLGGYSGAPSHTTDAVQGITAAVHAANPSASVVFDACGTSTTATAPAQCSAQTQADIKTADLVIVYVGTDFLVGNELFDRGSLAMPGNYDSLINQTAALGNPRMALVIQSAGPVDIDDVQGNFPAIVFSSFNGQSQGAALADVLFGKQNPSGHLDFTWFKDDSQLPGMTNYGLTPSQTGGLGRTYQYFTGTPTYPFGYGLSYSSFAYSHVTVDPKATTADGRINVHFDVTNTGTVPGATVAQVYVATPFSVPGVELPRKRLEGFQKTDVLQPGQTQSIAIPVKISDLALWDEQQKKDVVYDGTYQFQVATSSSDVVGTDTVAVSGAITPRVQHVTVQPDQVVFKPGDTLDLTAKNPWIADDTNPALEQPHAPADGIVEAVNNDESFVNLNTAKVSYASSNPDVATVSPTGRVTMIAHGAAQIRVTVGGVTGTAPIVVKRPFSLGVPSVVDAGTTVTATTSLPNAGSQPLSNVTMSLTVPSGWTVNATTPASFASVPAGQTASTTWNITTPGDAPPGSNEVNATATYTDANGRDTVTDTAQVLVPYDSLTAAFNNVGITSDSDRAPGDFDTGANGDSYSADALANLGITPGSTITERGLDFTWPNVPSGTPDNVSLEGQTVSLTGSGNTLGLIGSSTSGTRSGTVTVFYTDGSTQQATIAFPDFVASRATPVPGDDLVATTPYLNSAVLGQRPLPVNLYAAYLPLDPSRTVKAIQLPSLTPKLLHVFSMTIGSR